MLFSLSIKEAEIECDWASRNRLFILGCGYVCTFVLSFLSQYSCTFTMPEYLQFCYRNLPIGMSLILVKVTHFECGGKSTFKKPFYCQSKTWSGSFWKWS